MFISSSNFNVKQSGDITGSSALFDGNIKVTDMYINWWSGNIKLDLG